MPKRSDNSKSKLWYSPYDVAEVFGVSHVTARKWMKPGGRLYNDTQKVSRDSKELRCSARGVKELCVINNVPVSDELERNVRAFELQYENSSNGEAKKNAS